MTLTSFLSSNPNLNLKCKLTTTCLIISTIHVVWEIRQLDPKTRFNVNPIRLRNSILEALDPIKPLHSSEICVETLTKTIPKYVPCLRPYATKIQPPHRYLKLFLTKKVFSKSIINRSIQLLSEFSILTTTCSYVYKDASIFCSIF